MEFANNSSEYLGVMGATLKQELIDNLGIAKSTMSEISDIYKNLGITDKALQVATTTSVKDVTGVSNVGGSVVNKNITIGDTKVEINGGNVSQETIDELKSTFDNIKDELVQEIWKNVN